MAAKIELLYKMFNKESDTNIIKRGRKAAFMAFCVTTPSLKVVSKYFDWKTCHAFFLCVTDKEIDGTVNESNIFKREGQIYWKW